MKSIQDFNNFISCLPNLSLPGLLYAHPKEEFAFLLSAQQNFLQYFQFLQTRREDEQTSGDFSPISDSRFTDNSVEIEGVCSSPIKTEFDLSLTKLEADDKREDHVKLEVKQEPLFSRISSSQVQEIVEFVVNNLFLAPLEVFSRQQMCYIHDKRLLDLFGCLIDKYNSSIKAHDDMKRYIIRKAVKFCKIELKGSKKMTFKGAEVLFCSKYFDPETCPSDEHDNLDYFLPYKKNSRNKTANKIFISELFSSPSFYEDYLKFLNEFDLILRNDRARRITKFVKKIMVWIQDGQIENIKREKMSPWLEIWSIETKRIAFRFLEEYGNLQNKPRSRHALWRINQTDSPRENE